MDVYRQAADIIRIVREGNGTAKALCLRKEMQKKRQTYAVVCETLRHYELLEDVLEVSEFFKYYPQANKEFAMCMAYDVVIGKGVNTNNDTTARAVVQSSSYLREAYWKVNKHHVIAPRATMEKWEDNNGERASHGEKDAAFQVPRYARVNTLKIDKDTLIERLRRSAEAKKRQREEDDDEGGHHGGHVSAAVDGSEVTKRRRGSKNAPRVLPPFTEDPIVPSLLIFPPGTDLHAHPAVRSGQLILQDRASCLPACVLLDAVEVVTSFDEEGGDAEVGKAKANKKRQKRKPLEYIIDACAAPGNKTTQLAALGAPNVKIMATERDQHRAELLQKRVQSLGASDYVNTVNMDFFQLSSDDRSATEGILLDPSCSASGVVTRVDVALLNHRNQRQGGGPAVAAGRKAEVQEHDDADAEDMGDEDRQSNGASSKGAGAGDSTAVNPEAQGNEFSSNQDRVEKLARLQRKLLAHSLLSFDNCRTVVYSTCSVHEEENEGVVREVLEDERVQARGWVLSNIMPTQWKTRGIKRKGDTLLLDYTIRCDPAADATNGFYVARFDRRI